MAIDKINYQGQSQVIRRIVSAINDLIDGGGGGGSTVSYTQTLSSGTKTGEIEIDGVSTDMYAPTPPSALSELSDDSTHRVVTDTEKTTWSGKVSDNPTFTEASTRANIASGETFATILGKIKKYFTDLKSVAFSGSYTDLSDKPTIPTVNDGTLTIQQDGTTVGTFTANQSGNTTVNITGGGGGGGGHTIVDPSGTSMTQRDGLQFVDAGVTDDSVNDRTKVENVQVISAESELTSKPDGVYLGNYDDDLSGVLDASMVAYGNGTVEDIFFTETKSVSTNNNGSAKFGDISDYPNLLLIAAHINGLKVVPFVGADGTSWWLNVYDTSGATFYAKQNMTYTAKGIFIKIP